MKSWTDEPGSTIAPRIESKAWSNTNNRLNPDPLHVPEQFSAEIGTTEDHGAWFLRALIRGLLIAAFAGFLLGLVVGYVVGRLA